MPAGPSQRPLLAIVVLVLALGALAQAVPWALIALDVWTAVGVSLNPVPQALDTFGKALVRLALVGLALVALMGDASGLPGRVRAGLAFALLALLEAWDKPLYLPEGGFLPPAEQLARLGLHAAALAVLLWPSWAAGLLAALGVVLPQAGDGILGMAWIAHRHATAYPYEMVTLGMALHALGWLLVALALAWGTWREVRPLVAAPGKEPAPTPVDS